MADIKQATDDTFEALVLNNDKPVVVDFWAVWCGPCRMVAPEMEKLAAKYAGTVEVVKVDVDANPGLSRAFNILSIPTIAFFKPGAQPMGVVGFRPAEQLVIKNDKPVLVDFWAAWCGPCKLVAPEMEKLASKYEGAVDVVKVDVDANPNLSRSLNIMSIPTIALFTKGEQPKGVIGFRRLEELEDAFGLGAHAA